MAATSTKLLVAGGGTAQNARMQYLQIFEWNRNAWHFASNLASPMMTTTQLIPLPVRGDKGTLMSFCALRSRNRSSSLLVQQYQPEDDTWDVFDHSSAVLEHSRPRFVGGAAL